MKKNFDGDRFNDLKFASDEIKTSQPDELVGKKSTPFSTTPPSVTFDKWTGQVSPAAGRVEGPTSRASDNGCDHGARSQPATKSDSSLATAITPDRPASIPTSINLPKEVRDVEVGKKPDQHFLSIPKLLAAEESVAKSKPQADHFAFKTNDNPIINKSSKPADNAWDHVVKAHKADSPPSLKADAISTRATTPTDRIENNQTMPSRYRIEPSGKAEIQPSHPQARAEQPEIKRFVAMSTVDSKPPALDRPRESTQRSEDPGSIRRETFQVRGPSLHNIESPHLIGIDRRAAIVRGEIVAPAAREQKPTESKSILPERETTKARPPHEDANVGDKKIKIDVPSMLVDSTTPRGGTGMSGPRSDIFTVKTKKESEAQIKNQGQKPEGSSKPFIKNESLSQPLSIKEARVQDKVGKADKPIRAEKIDKICAFFRTVPLTFSSHFVV